MKPPKKKLQTPEKKAKEAWESTIQVRPLEAKTLGENERERERKREREKERE